MITFLYLITFAFLAFIIIKRIIHDQYYSLYVFFFTAISVLYFLIPAIVFLLGQYNQQPSMLVDIIYNSSTRDRIIIYLLALLCLGIVSLPQFFPIQNKIPGKLFRTGNSYDPDTVRTQTYKVCRFWFFALWAVGMIFTLIVIANIGITGLITHSGSARGEGDLPILSGSLLAYSINFSKLLIASLVPGILMFEIKKTTRMRVLLLLTFALCVLLQIFNAGKTSFIIFLAPVFIYLISKQGTIKIKHLIIAAVVVICMVPLLDNAFYFISTGESVSNYRSSWNILNYIMSVARQFTYPYSNMVMREPITEYYGYRFFLDYLAIVINILPASLLGGFQVETLYHLTTAYYKGVLSYTGGMPNDFLFFCYRQLGVFGILIIGFIVGIIIKLLDGIMFDLKKAFEPLNINPTHFFTCFCLTSVVFVLIEPLSVITSFPMIILTVVFALHIKFCLKNALISPAKVTNENSTDITEDSK